MSALKKHYGWSRRDGRRVCGAKLTGGLTARSEDEVTCQGCLQWLRTTRATSQEIEHDGTCRHD